MSQNFQGVIIEESLEKKEVLKLVKIISTKIEVVTPAHHTPQLTQWTLHTVEIPENTVATVAEELSASLGAKHGSWYADFKNDNYHFIVFRGRIFRVDRSQPEQYEAVKQFGLSLGIPDYQLDFLPDIK